MLWAMYLYNSVFLIKHPVFKIIYTDLYILKKLYTSRGPIRSYTDTHPTTFDYCLLDMAIPVNYEHL